MHPVRQAAETVMLNRRACRQEARIIRQSERQARSRCAITRSSTPTSHAPIIFLYLLKGNSDLLGEVGLAYSAMHTKDAYLGSYHNVERVRRLRRRYKTPKASNCGRNLAQVSIFAWTTKRVVRQEIFLRMSVHQRRAAALATEASRRFCARDSRNQAPPDHAITDLKSPAARDFGALNDADP